MRGAPPSLGYSNFGEVENELAVKLSDEDIERVLYCIDVANKLNKLRLTNCVNITGAGLEPRFGAR